MTGASNGTVAADPVPGGNIGGVGRGIGCAIGAYAAFSGADAIIKWLSVRYSIFDSLFVSSMVAFIPVLIFSVRQGGWRSLRPILPGWTLFRALLLTGSISCVLLAFARMPLTDGYAILFAVPVIVAVLSGPLLGERVGRVRWAAIIVGFVGVLVMLRPGFQTLGAGHMFAGLAVAFYSGALLVLRHVGRRERPGALLVVMLATMAVFSAVPTFIDFEVPAGPDLLLMGLAGILSGVAHILLVLAFRAADAALVAPFQYTQILYATVIGIIVFGDWPDPYLLLGAAFVIAAGIAIVRSGSKTPA
ncbi:MAG: DMT family transporter [Inquilinaceae bacterium]